MTTPTDKALESMPGDEGDFFFKAGRISGWYNTHKETVRTALKAAQGVDVSRKSLENAIMLMIYAQRGGIVHAHEWQKNIDALIALQSLSPATVEAPAQQSRKRALHPSMLSAEDLASIATAEAPAQELNAREWTETDFVHHMISPHDYHTDTEREYARTFWSARFYALAAKGVIKIKGE